ncbi:MAG: epoxyalkane--coenzyme M transferase, partial [Chloroflexi bacterium]|nr:epoxyalkane--coenzyme M transferase [Chloroflexota bacterium]
MRRSTERILVSHAGTVPRPADLEEMFRAGESRRAEFLDRLPSAVTEVVRHQAEIGIDVVNDGELSKLNFSHYARERMSGLEQPPNGADQGSARNIVARDARDYPEFHALGGGRMRRVMTPVLPRGNVNPTVVCTAPLAYVGQEAAERDIANFKAALAGLDVEGFLPAIAPGTIEHWLFNRYYASDEEFLYAIADAMHSEYRAIADAGINLQIDDPDLPDGWQMFPGMSVEEYRRYAQLRVEALNYALRDIPEEQIRLHVCWGSGHGPHQNDIPLEHI